MTTPRSLDLEAIQAFVLIADFESFTRAAEALGTSQSAVSLKLKRLETQLGRRLLERTPRLVRLSTDGEKFLERARELLSAQERAFAELAREERRLVLGISEHVGGIALPDVLARLKSYDAALIIDMRVGLSHELRDAFERGRFDAVIVRREKERRDGEVLFHEPLGWFAAPSFRRRAGEPLPLASLAAPCGVRALALRALEEAGIAAREAFVGGGVITVGAAVTAGLGVAALARRVAPPGAVDVANAFNLPPLPPADVVLHSRVSDARGRGALRTLAAALRSSREADKAAPNTAWRSQPLSV
jgi:DNA-binding transcriptional LysR family regulator